MFLEAQIEALSGPRRHNGVEQGGKCFLFKETSGIGSLATELIQHTLAVSEHPPVPAGTI